MCHRPPPTLSLEQRFYKSGNIWFVVVAKVVEREREREDRSARWFIACRLCSRTHVTRRLHTSSDHATSLRSSSPSASGVCSWCRRSDGTRGEPCSSRSIRSTCSSSRTHMSQAYREGFGGWWKCFGRRRCLTM